MKLRIPEQLRFVIVASTLTLAACSGGGGGSSGGGSSSTVDSLTISGTLATTSIFSKGVFEAEGNDFLAVTPGDLKVYAVAFTTPPIIKEVDVNSNGTFSISIPGAKGEAVSVVFKDKTDDSQVGVLVVEDSSSKDMNGNSAQSSSVILSDSVPLGAISLGSDGKVTVPKSQVASVVEMSPSVSTATAFDPTGTWYMKAFTGTLPTGYNTVTSDCSHGPCIGFPMTLVRLAGKDFTPNSGQCDTSTHPVTCLVGQGTIGTNDRYALSIWGKNFADGIGSCGATTGFTADEARAFGRIHVASLPLVGGNTISFGAYTYTLPAGFGGDGAPFNKPWMKTGATLTHPLQDCRPTQISHNSNTYNGWACRAKVSTGIWPGTPVGGPVYGWQVGVEGGGCFNSTTGKPVNVTNWGTIGMGTCTPSDASATYGAGFKTNTCTYTAVDHDNSGATPPINLSCSMTGGHFTDAAGAPTATPLTTNPGEYLAQPEAMAGTGDTCASIGSSDNAHTLAAYRCYAEAYWGATLGTLGCKRQHNFNWSATNPDDFAQENGRGKPENAFITNILNYNPDGQTATLEDEEKNNITVNTGANSSTFCEASRRTIISFKKISATRLLIDLKQSGQMNSKDAACIGAAKDAIAGKNVGGGDLQKVLSTENMIFYADTTP